MEFFIPYIITFGINMGILAIFIEVFEMNAYIAQFIALGIVSGVSFILQKSLVFKEKKQ